MRGRVGGGCLWRVVEARLRAGASVSGTQMTRNANSSTSGADDEPVLQLAALRSHSGVSSSGSVGSEGTSKAGRDKSPERIAVLEVIQCFRATEDEAQALAAILGAPKLVWSGS